MIPILADTNWRGISNCKNCGIRETALFADLKDEDFALIHAPIDDLTYESGQILCTENQRAAYLYTIRSGAVKLVRNASDGRVRIVRILRSGDVVGLEGLMSGHYEYEAIALETINVCRIPLQVVQNISRNTPRLHQQLLERWYKASKAADDWLADINFGTARQRVAQMILKMRHNDNSELTTLYSRQDMGAMSDLKLETVSREMSHWTQLGVIEPLDKKGRLYRIVNLNALLSA